MGNQQSKKSKKAGRNAVRCRSYQARNQREKNKLRKLEKRLKTHPNDKSAIKAIESCKVVIRGY